MEPPVVMVPGIDGSGPEHWQTLWEAELPQATRFAPSSWSHPDAEDWLRALESAVESADAPPVLVAHSLGCLTAARFAQTHPSALAAVLLVAAPDPEGPAFPAEATGFLRPAPGPLGCPAVVVLSRDDPYSDVRYGRSSAARWGAGVVDAGAAGHLNPASGYGPWPSGRALLDRMLAEAAR